MLYHGSNLNCKIPERVLLKGIWKRFSKVSRRWRCAACHPSCKFLLATCSENGPCCVKNVLAPSLVHINISGGKHWQLCCFSPRKISLFSRNIHFVHFIPTYNKRHLSKLWDTVQTCRLRVRSYLSGLRINITLIFMSSSSYLVHAISCRRILLKYRFL